MPWHTSACTTGRSIKLKKQSLYLVLCVMCNVYSVQFYKYHCEDTYSTHSLHVYVQNMTFVSICNCICNINKLDICGRAIIGKLPKRKRRKCAIATSSELSEELLAPAWVGHKQFLDFQTSPILAFTRPWHAECMRFQAQPLWHIPDPGLTPF